MSNFFNKKISKKKTKLIWSVVSIFAVVVFVSAMFFPGFQGPIKKVASRIKSLADVLSSVLVLQTNDFRSTNSESALIDSSLLTKAAQMKADDMANKGYFSHIGPSGEEPWVWFNKVGYVYSYAGENLAVDFTESSDVTTGWINSAKHKANLLNTNFTEVGIGISKGMYEGHQTTFVVQFFAKPFVREMPKTVAVVKKTVATVSVAEIKPTQQLASTSPETAVVTKIGVPEGQVLGTETNNTNPADNSNQIKWLVIIGVGLLVLITVIFKVATVIREKK